MLKERNNMVVRTAYIMNMPYFLWINPHTISRVSDTICVCTLPARTRYCGGVLAGPGAFDDDRLEYEHRERNSGQMCYSPNCANY